jgi:hypothetical protein
MIELSTIIDLVTFGSSIMFGIIFFSSKIKNNSGNFYLSLFLFCIGYITFKGIVYDIYEREIFQFDVSLFFLVFLFFYLNKNNRKNLKLLVVLVIRSWNFNKFNNLF